MTKKEFIKEISRLLNPYTDIPDRSAELLADLAKTCGAEFEEPAPALTTLPTLEVVCFHSPPFGPLGFPNFSGRIGRGVSTKQSILTQVECLEVIRRCSAVERAIEYLEARFLQSVETGEYIDVTPHRLKQSAAGDLLDILKGRE